MALQPPLRDRQGPGSHISGTWPGSRNHGLPRGIENSGVSCYMNSALQNLAHLPKFCNWIVQHNDPTHGADWPCRPDDHNRKLPANREEDQAITQMGTGIMQCVACLMRDFIIEYWSHKSKLPADHRTLRPLQTMADRWFCQSPDAGTLKQKSGESERDFIRRKLAKETAPQRKSRVANARGQQDSDEFLMKVLPAVRESIDPTNHRRLDEFDYLFTMTLYEEARCTACNHVRGVGPLENTRYLGFNNTMIAQSTENYPDLKTAIRDCEILATELEDLPLVCTSCDRTGSIQRPKLIEAAPEYLRVNLELSSHDSKGNHMFKQDGTNKYGKPIYDVTRGIKNKHPIIIPNLIDLTALLHHAPAAPVRYKLISKIMHSGDYTRSGHYTAAVTSAPDPNSDAPYGNRRFFINDTASHAFPPTATDGLTRNPHYHDSQIFDTSTLFYVRLPNKKGDTGGIKIAGGKGNKKAEEVIKAAQEAWAKLDQSKKNEDDMRAIEEAVKKLEQAGIKEPAKQLEDAIASAVKKKKVRELEDKVRARELARAGKEEAKKIKEAEAKNVEDALAKKTEEAKAVAARASKKAAEAKKIEEPAEAKNIEEAEAKKTDEAEAKKAEEAREFFEAAEAKVAKARAALKATQAIAANKAEEARETKKFADAKKAEEAKKAADAKRAQQGTKRPRPPPGSSTDSSTESSENSEEGRRKRLEKRRRVNGDKPQTGPAAQPRVRGRAQPRVQPGAQPRVRSRRGSDGIARLIEEYNQTEFARTRPNIGWTCSMM